jgi:hypothetical protein
MERKWGSQEFTESRLNGKLGDFYIDLLSAQEQLGLMYPDLGGFYLVPSHHLPGNLITYKSTIYH